ncbi:MAG: hypothetical protein ACLP4V_34305 [Methylocella sp.]
MAITSKSNPMVSMAGPTTGRPRETWQLVARLKANQAKLFTDAVAKMERDGYPPKNAAQAVETLLHDFLRQRGSKC